jgi:hypothetical protein
MNIDKGLVGHWPFAQNCRDYSIIRHDSRSRHVKLGATGPAGVPRTAASFDGRRSFVEVPNHAGLNFGTREFSIAVWVYTEKGIDGIVGDIVAKYDPAKRKGFNLSVISHPGVTSSHTNDRNIHFGIDDGSQPSGWRDCGRPGQAVLANLAVCNGDLYAATLEPEADQSGHVYRYAGGREWEHCGSPAPCNYVSSCAVYQGALHCGVSRFKCSGHCLPDSPNKVAGGKVFRYEGKRKWKACGRLDGDDGINSLVVFRGILYATPLYAHGVYAYRPDGRWNNIGPDARVISLGFWRDNLYALTSGRDSVYRLEQDGRWSDVGRPRETAQLYSFAVYRGRPYIGTWPFGDVFRYDGRAVWAEVGSPGYTREVMGMAVYNGKLYAGTLPMAAVYRYDGGLAWHWVGTLDNTPGVQLRRAWSMAVYNGKLYCGTLPSGHVMSMRAGKLASYDRPLEPGWRHVAAVRRKGHLAIALDGRAVARSSRFSSERFNVTNEEPLSIGFGAHEHFKDRMADLRIYNRALTPRELSFLACPNAVMQPH